MTERSAHLDLFARDNLPPRDQWPDLIFTLSELTYPERMNAATAFLDARIAAGDGDRICLISPAERWTYAELADRVNRIANVLTRELGMVPGNRVLLRAANEPMLVAAYFAVLKAGGIVVPTMPLLRAKELSYPIGKAEIRLALCDVRLLDELAKAAPDGRTRIVTWGDGRDGGLESLMAKPGYDTFAACDTAADDVCLIAFTSGTTGVPKGTMHFHRDLLAICDTYARHVLRASPSDRFIGSPPLAFTYGLGGLVLFPMRIGASSVLLEKAPPETLMEAIETWGATVCFTAPTAYRAMLALGDKFDISSLRKCVSAGETLPKATFEAWREATGIAIQDGLGSTEMLHMFICCREDEMRGGATGKAIPGFEAARDRRGRQGGAARNRRPAGRARPDRLPLFGRRAPARLCDRRVERDRRHLFDGAGRVLRVPGAIRRHDRLGRLQYCRSGGGSRAPRAPGGRRVRRGGRARPGSRPDREGLCRAA